MAAREQTAMANMFCNFGIDIVARPEKSSAPEVGANTSQGPREAPWKKGTRVSNHPECGTYGKPCCVRTGAPYGGAAIRCGPQPKPGVWGIQGRKGYCANPPGFKGTGKASSKDLICTECPETVDPSLKKTDPEFYGECAPDEQQRRDAGLPASPKYKPGTNVLVGEPPPNAKQGN